jgi:hypothetical protein
MPPIQTLNVPGSRWTTSQRCSFLTDIAIAALRPAVGFYCPGYHCCSTILPRWARRSPKVAEVPVTRNVRTAYAGDQSVEVMDTISHGEEEL